MRIIIIGAGFAGLKCANKLGSHKNHEILLFNKTYYTTMLPSLPDVAGGRVKKKHLIEQIIKLVPKKVQVKVETVTEIDLKNMTVQTSLGMYNYDILVLAQGAQINYFGFNQNLDKMYKLENVIDAEKINQEILQKAADGTLKNIVISGAGFTGLELGANLHTLLKAYPQIAIQLIEKSDSILTPSEPDFAAFVKDQLEKVGLKFYLKNTIKEFDGSRVVLEDGTVIDNVVLIWTSGLKRAINIIGQPKEMPNGRLVVENDLRLVAFDNVFAIGDCSAFMDNGKCLRMAVNYASMMGACAGENIKRIIKGKALKSFKPFDPGWVLPVHHTSVGYAFNIKVRGRIGIALHFMIIGIKNYNLSNMFAYFWYAFKFFFSKKNYRGEKN
jgi:NADH dehydrogenase